MLELKLICESDKERVLDYIKELVNNGSQTDGIWYTDAPNFEIMLESLRSHENLEYLGYSQKKPINYQYLLVRKSDDKLVGMFSLRPFMTKDLDEDFGGTIGYSVRPSERRKGYASLGLKLAIDRTLEYNPDGDIMVCCNRDNIGSRKAILNNGGTLIETFEAIIALEKYIISR